MIFQSLFESAIRGELILVEGGLCHWHLRRDGQLTIREIIVIPERQCRGIGSAILDTLKNTSGIVSIVARCPSDLPSNLWYKKRGFKLIGEQRTKSGKTVKVWKLSVIDEKA